MTATPTPGDLSARLLAESQRRESEWAHIPTNNPRSKFVHDERLRELLREAAAALSALPAAGGAVAWRNHDAAIDAKALATAQEIALMWGQDRSQFVSRIQVAVIDAMRWFDAATTPQPSAAEDYESWAKQERQREDTATRLGSAAVGAQGDGDSVEHAVDRFLAWPLPKDFGPDCGISFTPLGHPNGWPSGTNLLTAAQATAMFQHCLTAPAAGEGVDEHPDDLAVDRFAAAMKAKLAKKRAEGRGGWDDPAQCPVELLSNLLHEHVAKGDPVDVGNLAMMLHQRGSGVLPPQGDLQSDLNLIWHSVSDTKETNAAHARLQAALTRQPVAGPAATPTDGGEGS